MSNGQKLQELVALYAMISYVSPPVEPASHSCVSRSVALPVSVRQR
jgi:hypothetical protein